MNRSFFSKKPVIAIAAVILLSAVLYLILLFITPSELIDKTIGTPYKNPGRVNAMFYGILLRLIVLGTIILIAYWLYDSGRLVKARSIILSLLNSVSKIVSLKLLLIISLIYLAVLFVISVMNYDLGTDEAWYICVGENFAKSLVPYLASNGKIFIIDTITMLPYYVLCLIQFTLGLTEVWHFKLAATILSAASIYIMFRVSAKEYGKQTAIVFLFFLAAQPGFGFVATSFFGEILQAGFLFLGLYIWLKEPAQQGGKNIIYAALMFTLAIHTKFQLIFIISVVLMILHFTDRKSFALKLMIYTVVFSILVSLARTIPVALKDPTILRQLVVINLFAEQTAKMSLVTIMDKIQMLNKFFPAALFVLITLGYSFYCMKNTFDRFIMLFSSVTILWWVFLYVFSPYRVPFMGFIFLALMAAQVIRKVYAEFAERYPSHTIALKYATAVSVLFVMMYGYSANLIYAYIGYNDGVQFDLDGNKSRLFLGAERDNSQKEFYEELKRTVSPVDTIYNYYSVTDFYLKNPLFTLSKMKEVQQYSPGEKYVLVARDMYPLGFETIYSQLDSLGGSKRLIIKKPGHELYGITPAIK